MKGELDDEFREEWEEISKAVDAELHRLRAERMFPLALYDGAFHLTLSGGKRVRPFLVVKSAQLFGAEKEKALPAAVAVELLHNFTLIHDDIMDEDEFRRRVPTTHVLWGVPVAIAAGDALFSILFSYVIEGLRDKGCRPSLTEGVVEYLAKGALRVCEGQVMDIRGEKYISTESEYLDMVARKTASLFEVSCVLGGLIGNADQEDLKLLRAFGRDVGIMFQIVDDILGLMGDPEVTGKPVGSDLRRGKMTMMVVYALRHASLEDRSRLESILGDEGAHDDDIKWAGKLIASLGSVEYARTSARSFLEGALTSINSLPLNEHRAMLEAMAHFIYSRER